MIVSIRGAILHATILDVGTERKQIDEPALIRATILSKIYRVA